MEPEYSKATRTKRWSRLTRPPLRQDTFFVSSNVNSDFWFLHNLSCESLFATWRLWGEEWLRFRECKLVGIFNSGEKINSLSGKRRVFGRFSPTLLPNKYNAACFLTSISTVVLLYYSNTGGSDGVLLQPWRCPQTVNQSPSHVVSSFPMRKLPHSLALNSMTVESGIKRRWPWLDCGRGLCPIWLELLCYA